MLFSTKITNVIPTTQTKENKMTENTFDFDQANFPDLLNEAKRLRIELTTLENKSRYTESAFMNRQRSYDEAKVIVQSLIEENEIDNEESVVELIRIFDIEILKTVEFTLSVEITGTVEIPMGTELDEYSFSLDSISYNGEDISVDNEVVRIEDWNFSE